MNLRRAHCKAQMTCHPEPAGTGIPDGLPASRSRDICGPGDGTPDPQSTATRAEAAQIFLNYANRS